MADSDAHIAAVELLSDLESCLGSWKDNPSSVLPTAVQFYRLGLILHSKLSHSANVTESYHQLLESLPNECRKGIFNDLRDAAVSVLKEETQSAENVQATLESLAGLYQSSPLAIQSTKWSLEQLRSLISRKDKHQPPILCILSIILWNKELEDLEHLLPIINLFQEEGIWKNLVEYQDEHNPGWSEEMMTRFSDSTQREYLSSLLDSAALQEDENPPLLALEPEEAATTLTSVAAITPEDAIQQRIDQVRQVLPDLGEGFVETALSYYKGDVERTVAALLDESQLPTQLQVLDRSLPRRHRNLISKQEEEDARLAAKAALKAAQRQEEEEALAVDKVMRRDEYDDDYDDQYDSLDEVGGADTGLYDNFDDVRTYNRVLKEAEAEQSFWQENRNLNRSNNTETKSGGEKAYRGPDKVKGGRIPTAGRGGRGRGRGRKDEKGGANKDPETKTSSEDQDKKPNKSSQRHKARKMASRREQQKKANAKRSGAG